jgi:hypothetical protein
MLHCQQQAAHHDGQPQDNEARAVPDGKAVGTGRSASHVCCVPHGERLATMARVAASSRIEPITTTMKSAHGA